MARTGYLLCRHIKSNGEQCGSPRLRNAELCYFHARLRDRHRAAVTPRRNAEVMLPVIDKNGALMGMEAAPEQTLDLGLLEDRTSVQMAISTVLNALAAGRLEMRRATALLYGLQLASTNCVRQHMDHGHAINPVCEVEEAQDGLALAR